MPRGSYRMIQRTEDATALAVERAEMLAHVELWLRSQMRRGNVDAETFGRLLDDVYDTRRVLDHLRHELAELRNGR